MAVPTLALIPAAQGSKFYSVLPTDGVGDFDFTRASTATRVNSKGLIEEVASGVSRLDYTGGGCPHHLLEPQRTNLVAHSEDFSDSYWQKARATITSNQIISPDGALTADMLTATDTAENYCQQNISSTVSGNKQTTSFFVKKGTSDFCHILLWDIVANGARQWFDLTNGIVGNSTTFGSGVSVDGAKMINYGNDWYKCIVVFNNSNTPVRVRVSASNSNGLIDSTVGKTIYIFGAQLEQQSYATSYIPNFGTALGVTRLAETATGSGDASTFNDSEGVLMAEISFPAPTSSQNQRIAISDGTVNNRVLIQNIGGSANRLQFYVIVNNVISTGFFANVNDITSFNKIAFKYKENDFSVWFNGIEILTDTSGATFPIGTLTELDFNGGNAGDFYGETKQLQYYNTALTDLEIETLTSFTSFNEMALNLNYTI